MKDFIKWLGVNEKVAKVAVWIFIILGCLIIINSALASIGFPNYQINMENLKQISFNSVSEMLIGWLVAYLNFWAIILLVFRVSNAKKILSYSFIYLLLNILITKIFNEGIAQIFIAIFLILFSYLYSKRNIKYIGYTIISLVLNTVIQGITYMFKIKYLDFNELGYATKALLSIDYFIIMAMIILVKEIYLKKRGENECLEEAGAEQVGFGSENSKTKQKSHKKSHKKWLT